MRLGRSFPNNQLVWRNPHVAKYGPVFDSVGTGGSGGQSISWTQTVAPGAKVAIAYVIEYTSSGSPAIGCTFGGTAMTLSVSLGSYGNTTLGGGAGNYVYLYAFALVNPPTGTVTVSTSISGGLSWGLTGNSITYTSASGIGTGVSNSGSTTAASHTISAAAGQTISQCFLQDITPTTGFTGYNQTQRWKSPSTANYALVIGDAPGGGSVPFSATAAAASPAWGSLAIPLNH